MPTRTQSVSDTAEFERLIEAHASAVHAIAFRITCDRGAAEEIAQDAFIEFWRTGPEIASADHARFWLRRVAVHRATDWLRKRMRRPMLVDNDGFVETDSTARHLSPHLASRLEALLQSIPESLRAAVVLRYGEDDMTPEEIASLLGQPLATVRSNLHRALRLLRRKANTVLQEYARG